ncbi:hypothetical protein [uncultured Paraglaciecola sp.]|uniref:hypothetical protein n=1 Tax=uncultured Paraglaciecola sp. TaxID=1765024 RepID=UPI0030D89078|tara:strand:- start:43958 stop:44542 length:585 start_codon:yes stop_codon:yes gene_type:complete
MIELIMMWVWRGLVCSVMIALLVAISGPARALDKFELSKTTASLVVDFTSEVSHLDDIKALSVDVSLSELSESDHVLSRLQSQSIKLVETIDSDTHSPDKAPAYQLRINPNISLPPFERHAASTFGTAIQIDAIFLLVYEFQPEILGIRHFLAPLNTNGAVPWYLRPDAANNHGRTAGWKDGNTLYTGTITYLS